MRCGFCEIISKPENLTVLFANQNFIAFLDPHPDTPGHTVVAPREHFPTILELPDNLIIGILPMVKEITAKIKTILQPDGFTFGWNHGRAAGQMSDHLHLHIIPRYENDGGGSIHSVVKIDNINFGEVAGKF